MQAEAIYKGATRPAMKLGIPLVPLVVLFGTGMLLIMWGGTLVSWWIALAVVFAFVPALLWMRFVTAKDDQRFRQMFVAMKLRFHDIRAIGQSRGGARRARAQRLSRGSVRRA